MKIGLTGGSGLIGSELKPFLEADGHMVSLLKRGADYDPENQTIKEGCLKDFDVIINLAGESIATRWSEEQKKKIKESRVETTKLLVGQIKAGEASPKIFINASAVGFYGDRGEQTLDESSEKGTGFLADVVEAWEKPLEDLPAQVRACALRFGMVLSPKGGGLKQMVPPFKMGLGGSLGSGEQYMSWVAIDDVLGAIQHVIHNNQISGILNIVSPHPVRNKEFTETLGKVLNRPTALGLPVSLVKLMFGEMGKEMLLSSAKVEPKRLLETSYPFLYPNLTGALNHYLNQD